jgi:primary-amine oxidase
MAVKQRERGVVSATHPLSPLTATEIEQAVEIVRSAGKLSDIAKFVTVELNEPSKDVMLQWEGEPPIDREAFAVIRDRGKRTTCEVVISLTKNVITSWRDLDEVQPSIMLNEFEESERAIRNDARWQEAMRKRGITDFDLAIVDPWSAGYYSPEDDPREGRLLRALTWIRTSETDNGYARPIEGLVVYFNLDTMQVLRVEDDGVVPLPPTSGNYDSDAIQDPNNVPHFDGLRQGLKPLEIVQPEGVSFAINGNEIRWQGWQFRVGWTPREGLVLYTIGYQDRGKLRPLCYRASITDLFVPYGDPKLSHRYKQTFDAGEYGLGLLANSLQRGCDCLGEIRYLEAVMADSNGEPWTIKNAICIHEEDNGILWKHRNNRSDLNEVRRARRLVVSFIATISNYDYGFYWYFYQDGTIEFEAKLTGVISTGALKDEEKPSHGTEVAPRVYGPHHQHYYCVRLDMMVDGINNSVVEVESESEPISDENPLGNAWVNRETVLTRESEAQRLVSPLTARTWKIVNPSVHNQLGQPVAYRLVPGDNVLPFLHRESSPLRRAGFITRHLWVTHYDRTERFAAGDYANQHPGGAGLPQYVQADRNLVNTDIVIWYTFGSHHTVRPEDWPVMPVRRIGFHLTPFGFFVGNPSLDLPPSLDGHHASCAHSADAELADTP